MNFDAQKYLTAQEGFYSIALSEISSGRKRSHWIWYIFPQIAGLGHSSMCKRYDIQNIQEARAYLSHDILRSRLIEISEALLEQDGDIRYIAPSPDCYKICSCMTLFREADSSIPVFQQVLDKFFHGQADKKTLNILAEQTSAV